MTTRYAFDDAGRQIAVRAPSADGTTVVVTGWGGARLADWTGAGADLRLYGTNAHHDVTFTTGTAGTVTATARYDPWGTLAASSGTLPDFGFQG